MSTIKISQLPAAVSVAGGELVPLVQGGATVAGEAAALRNFVSVYEYMTPVQISDAQGLTSTGSDHTAAIQAAIEAVQILMQTTQGAPQGTATLCVPAGVYKLTDTLEITGNLRFVGDGSNATIFNFTSSLVVPAFLIGPQTADNSYVWGTYVGGFRVNCSEGSAVCDGLVTAASGTNAVLTQCVFNDILVKECRDGFNIAGVLYMCEWTNCKVVNTARYGFTNSGSKEIVYNSFRNCEVTQTLDNAWSYYLKDAPMNGAFMSNITCDGCCYFSMPYSHIDGLAVEGIYATTPPDTNVVTLAQVSQLSNTAIIEVPNAKCDVGIYVLATNVLVNGVRVPGSANSPAKLISLHSASGGVLTDVFNESVGTITKLETYTSAATLARWKIAACGTITDVTSFNANVVAALPTPSDKFNGIIATLPLGAAPYSRSYICQNTAASGYQWTELVTYDQKSATIGTTLTAASAPLSLGNPAGTAGRYWSVGPSSTDAFIVFNDATAGAYISYGGTSWVATSDERLKDIIEPIAGAMDKVAALRAVIGKFKSDPAGTRRSFLIAQDLQRVFPEAVDDSDPDKLGASYTDVIPLLVAAVKELQIEIAALKRTGP